MATLDFTSSLYLGLHHPSRSLPAWDRLTAGVPAALGELPGTGAVAAAAARWLGRESAVLSRSSLHAFVDCFAAIGTAAGWAPALTDAGAYPIATWAARAAGPGAPARFRHHDPRDLARCLRRGSGRPIVVTDGFCPGCGRVAPLPAYLELVRHHGGLLLLDDTQALGVLGRRGAGSSGTEPSRVDDPEAGPFGLGGAGSPAWTGAAGPGLVMVASLAKGLGAPLAVVAGDRSLIDRIRAGGPSRMHTGPPTAADLGAAAQALRLNRRDGDRRRRVLAALVARLRVRLAEHGLTPVGGLFPIQSLPVRPPSRAVLVARRLAAAGIRVIAQRPSCGRPDMAMVTLLVTARHCPADIDFAAAALAGAVSEHEPNVEDRRVTT